MNERLPQFDFSDREIAEAIQKKRLLSMEIEFTRACNYQCPYCYAADGDNELSGELTGDEIRTVINQAADLGARKIVVLGGEPLIYNDLFNQLDYILSRGMSVEIFTNGSLINRENAREFYARKCRLVVKLNSLNPDVHDRLTGCKNSLEMAINALDTLLDAGYKNEKDMLAATTVLSTLNIHEAPVMWRQLRKKKIMPYFECITPQGRLLENQSLLPDSLEVKHIFNELARIDRDEFGYDWEPQPPLAGQRCLRHLYSCVVKSNGDVTPCVGLDCVIGNTKKSALDEILKESQILSHLKEHRKYIKEPCRTCDKSEHCYGCRGTAWQLTGDYLAADPTCWHNVDKQAMISVLPIAAKKLLPHKDAMAFIDTLTKTGDRTGETESLVRHDNIFLDKDGFLASEALIEYAAQSAAVLDTFEHDGIIAEGLLTEIKTFNFISKAKAGEMLRVMILKEDELEEWNILSFEIYKNGIEKIAEGKLILCIFRD